MSSNSAIVSVGSDGLATAHSSGLVVISAMNEGALGVVRTEVVLSGDSDGDDVPDDVELANGLDPNNSVDALEDFDGDGLTNKQELVDLGTKIRKADSDDDGISDGEEIVEGVDGFVTDPVLPDSDGDGIRDGLEVATGSDPTDRNSLNLTAALTSIELTPATFTLTVNALLGEASAQLRVVGHLRDGWTVDLTPASRGTSYQSNDLFVCNFGGDDGQVFASGNGTCTIRVTSNGFTDAASGIVSSFAPVARSSVNIPGFANNVDVVGDLAFVAAGSAGLQVVDVSNRELPVIVGSFDTAGNANDVKVVGPVAFVADGWRGVQLIDVSNRSAPTLLGSVNLPGEARDLVVRESMVFVAAGSEGLHLVDASDPTAPVLIGSIVTGATANGVDVADDFDVAVVAQGASVAMVDVMNPDAPHVIGEAPAGDARDVTVQRTWAFIADRTKSFTAIDIGNPMSPVVQPSTDRALGGLLADVALFGQMAFGADIFFVNGIPIIDTSTAGMPIPRAILNFAVPPFLDDEGTGIAVDNMFVYLTADQSGAENGSSGSSRLLIGQYLDVTDRAGMPPVVAIETRPAGGATEEGQPFRIRASVTDDVQVMTVEFFVDGALAFADTTFPFEHLFNAPRLSQQPSFTIRVRATDTGGNTTATNDLTIALLPDMGRPRIRWVSPPDGSFRGDVDSVAAFTNEALDPNSLADGGFSLIEAGTDGEFVTADDVAVAPISVEFRPPVGGAFLSFDNALAGGRYRATIAETVTDLTGNSLAAAKEWTFTVFDVANDGDHDCVPDAVELTLQLDPNNPDSDNDGRPDGDADSDHDGVLNCDEVLSGLDPARSDTDSDGLDDRDERERGSDPLRGDSDGDGFGDGDEVASGSDPLDPDSLPVNPFASIGEIQTTALSVLNAVDPCGALGGAVSPSCALAGEAETRSFSVLNRATPCDAVGSVVPANCTSISEVESPPFSLVNAIDPCAGTNGVVPATCATTIEAEGRPFSVENLAE